ncbi:MAG: amidohydrolase, partial [Planctomycetota bacterium]
MNSKRDSFRISAATLLLLAATSAVCAQLAAAQESGPLKRKVIDRVDSIEPLIEEIAIKLWDYSELALLETRSADLLVRKLDEAGFVVETGVADMPTAFVATYGAGSPVLGILAEYDALPGVGNQAIAERKPRADVMTAGQGGGHNLFGAACVGGAIAAAQVVEAEG